MILIGCLRPPAAEVTPWLWNVVFSGGAAPCPPPRKSLHGLWNVAFTVGQAPGLRETFSPALRPAMLASDAPFAAFMCRPPCSPTNLIRGRQGPRRRYPAAVIATAPGDAASLRQYHSPPQLQFDVHFRCAPTHAGQ